MNKQSFKVSKHYKRAKGYVAKLKAFREKTNNQEFRDVPVNWSVSSSIVENVGVTKSAGSTLSPKSDDFLNNLYVSYPDSDSSSDCSDNLNINTNTFCNTVSDNQQQKTSLSLDLSGWALKHNIPHVAVNDLLKVLQQPMHNELPLDARTLLKTPKQNNVQVIEPGTYYHFGLENSIKNLLCFMQKKVVLFISL